MSQREFLAWADYYRRWPFDDFHRFHRPAALIASALCGGGPEVMEARLEWLQPGQRFTDNHTDADRDLFKAAGIRV